MFRLQAIRNVIYKRPNTHRTDTQTCRTLFFEKTSSRISRRSFSLQKNMLTEGKTAINVRAFMWRDSDGPVICIFLATDHSQPAAANNDSADIGRDPCQRVDRCPKRHRHMCGNKMHVGARRNNNGRRIQLFGLSLIHI